ncbi:hypothetical protein CEXT_47711 [Caerostris extrusa]|uniref:Uncharacterized protein n=1 Tax=Caerostris extrusa TaxID=172846 RepID=A0AAV4W3Q4_CAEEX|nr:hypothetical protein CEXT_47711 [Caerostris extrusa]
METTVMRGLTYQIFGVQKYFSSLFPCEEISGRDWKGRKEKQVARDNNQPSFHGTAGHPFWVRVPIVTARDDSFYDACTRRINKRISIQEAFSAFPY